MLLKILLNTKIILLLLNFDKTKISKTNKYWY